MSTIARTRAARLLAVTLAEGLRLVPRGTHDPALFVRRDELVRWGSEVGLDEVRLAGERPRLLATLATWTVQLARCRSDRVAYSVLLRGH